MSMPSVEAMRPAVILADLIPVLTCALAVASPRGSFGRLPMVVVQASYFANAFSHIGQTIFFQDYSPGTITALLLSIPVNMYLFRRACREQFAPRRDLVLAGAVGIATMPLSIVGLQQLGGMLSDSW
jgi:hypothetical protein